MDLTPALEPFVTADEAIAQVLTYLQTSTGLALWMVTRTVGDDWIVLQAADHSYGVRAGDVFRWSDSFCIRMIQGEGPQVAPDARAIPAYAAAPIAAQLTIGAYIGVPLIAPDGSLFGTLCAIDPHMQSVQLAASLATVQLFARLLVTILRDELRHQDALRALERAESEAHLDGLTHLLNRRGWEQLVAHEEARCCRYGNPAGVILIDLDDLKFVNDQQGHASGDQLIRSTAQLLRQSVRTVDIVARLGGDEFSVVAVDTPEEGMLLLLDRIESTLNAHPIRASIGWAMRNPRGDLTQALAEADRNMYITKRLRKTKLDTRPASTTL